MAPINLKKVIPTLFILFAVFLPDRGRAQDIAPPQPDLSNITAPFHFSSYCMPSENEFWGVGGLARGYHLQVGEPGQEFRVVEGDAVDEPSLYGVYFNNSEVGWIVGEEGAVFHTIDNGNRWIRQLSGVNVALSSVTCVDKKYCWIGGEDGIILRTTNAGKNWAITRTNLTDRLTGIEFVNRKVGWAVGDDGHILHTTDSGITWNEQPICASKDENCPEWVPENLQAVKFMDEKNGWVAGFEGIARTIDGGKNWEVTHIEPDYAMAVFVGLVSHDGRQLWAINKGDNYCSENAGKTWKPCPQAKAPLTEGQYQPLKIAARAH